MWVEIQKEQIKAVTVGEKVRVNGVETRLTSHYNGGDYGFDTEDDVPDCPSDNNPVDTFADMDWRNPYCVVEVWEEEL